MGGHAEKEHTVWTGPLNAARAIYLHFLRYRVWTDV